MANVAIIGAQWETKAKVRSSISSPRTLTSSSASRVAITPVILLWWTVEKLSFTSIPSGALHPNKLCVIGNGVVVDPEVLLEEITALKNKATSWTTPSFESAKKHT
mgnify:CR=1 FL=1